MKTDFSLSKMKNLEVALQTLHSKTTMCLQPLAVGLCTRWTAEAHHGFEDSHKITGHPWGQRARRL